MSAKNVRAVAPALVLVPLLVLTGCATSGGTSSDASSSGSDVTTSDTTFTWAYDQEFSSYNVNTADGNLQANIVVINPVVEGFWQYSPDGSIVANTEFGSYEKVSDDPLTVEYTIADDAVWSDGEPIDCDDMVLTWLAHSGLSGDSGFSTSSTQGYRDMKAPECSDGDREITVEYQRPYADWATQFGPGQILPAHVVEQQGGLDSSIIDYADDPTSADLARAVEFYNEGWTPDPGDVNDRTMLSSGPYEISAWDAGQSITLTANPDWWGTPPRTGTIVIRFLSASQQVQELRNGTVDAIDPQPQTDTLEQLETLGDAVQVEVGQQYSYEHLDFNFGSDVFADLTARQAFAKCVPRQRIVTNLVAPQDPDATVAESRFVYPFQPSYSGYADSIGGSAYDTVDIAGAKQLLGGKAITVRLGWRKDSDVNQLRADEVALIQESCAQAGITVEDVGTSTFFSDQWVNGDYDVALFAWTGSPQVSTASDAFVTGSGTNPGGYSSSVVDGLVDDLSTTVDADAQTAILQQIDTQLWSDLASIPLYVLPSVLATRSGVEGVVYNATQADLTWNAAEWIAP